MSTNFPGFFDSYTVKADNVDTVSAAHINNLQDAVVALEGQFGIKGNVALCEGRLTLSTSDPAPTADQTAKTTIYYFPYLGNRIAIYNTTTTGWEVLQFGSASVSVPATTSTNFDIFAYNNSGTLALQTVSWTNDTTRATAITRQDGIYCKSGDLGKRYLGTGRTTGSSGQTADSLTNRLLWNYYNRLGRPMLKRASSSHTYNTATYRAWNNAATDTQLNFVCGLADESIMVTVWDSFGRTAATDGQPRTAFGLNTTSSSTFDCNHIVTSTIIMWISSTGFVTPVTGYNYGVVVEYAASPGATAPTFYETELRINLKS